MNVKASELGWFYHAPPRPKNLDPVIPPPPSQIPGLSDVSQLPPEAPQHRLVINERDSKYVRLAKMGGRQNLLCMDNPPALSSEPVGYPRCEWYYDQVLSPSAEDSAPKEPYQFMLPSYMVYEPCPSKKSTLQQPSCTGATPYAHDNTTVYEREGSQATDKTMKLAEERQPGYGVRAEKQQRKQCRQSQPCSSVGKLSTHQTVDRTAPDVSFSKEIEKEGVDMKRLLSFGYSDDYERQKHQWADRDERLKSASDDEKAAKTTVKPRKTPNTQCNKKKPM